jgi:hypothetical protein
VVKDEVRFASLAPSEHNFVRDFIENREMQLAVPPKNMNFYNPRRHHAQRTDDPDGAGLDLDPD